MGEHVIRGSGRIGDSIHRVEDTRLLTGAGRFTDDVATPDALHAVFVRSPHAHAVIRGIDAGAAAEFPGATVLTGEDLAAAGVGALPNPSQAPGPGYGPYGGMVLPNPPWLPLARGRVRHVGETVALVIAPSLA
jgi:aerobic carbon-monoxide dehydrogenase large subunit